MEDKRKYMRFQAQGSVAVRVKDPGHSFEASLSDIGIEGIGVYSSEKLEIGKEVELEITTKYSDNPLKAGCKVIYAQQMNKLNSEVKRIGFEFIEVDKRAVRYIVNSIQEEICNKVRNK
jgi:c-di-GMP-binding flagellar brake protein YcgR